MDNFLLITASVFWLGILTAISPCPLATNIAAISFISKKISKPSLVFLSGVFYTIGRTLAYILVGILIVKSFMESQQLALALQHKMNLILGPLLIVTGLVLFDFIKINFSGFGGVEKLQNFVADKGLFGSLLLGFIFALSFCPVSTAIFFGSLIPLALAKESSIFLPAVYGVATGLPVLFLASVLAFGTNKIALIYNKLSAFENITRKITGGVFILVGFYFVVIYIF